MISVNRLGGWVGAPAPAAAPATAQSRSAAAQCASTSSPASGFAAAAETAGRPVPQRRARREVARRLRDLDLATESGRRDALRGFVEAVLYDRFGEGLVQSPRFAEIVHDVQAALEADAATALGLLQTLGELSQQENP